MSAKTIEGVRADVHDLLEKLREERDELNVQMHLAKAEIHDEWSKLEPKWDHFRDRATAVSKSAEEASEDAGVALRLLGDELRNGYTKIKDSFRS
jgi:hypothetical protein